MNFTKFLIASLVGAIVFFFAGWLIYGILLSDIMAKAMTPEANALNKTEPNLVVMFVSNLMYGLLYAYIFERWAKITTFMGGATAGTLIAVLIAAAFDLQFVAMTNMINDITFVFIDIACNAVIGAMVGGVIGLTLGYGRKD
ncbi:MAG: DUF1761 family protein [Bacteroidetes bacterium]|nr:DUF1761 family protein [Bacteroidota bacterium]